jgi:hypothetical protein
MKLFTETSSFLQQEQITLNQTSTAVLILGFYLLISTSERIPHVFSTMQHVTYLQKIALEIKLCLLRSSVTRKLKIVLKLNP